MDEPTIDLLAAGKPKHSVNWTFQNLVKPYFEGITMNEWMGKNKADYKKYYENTENPMIFDNWVYRRHVNIKTRLMQKGEKQAAVDGQGDVIKQPDIETPKPYGKWIGFGIVLTIGLGITYLLVSDKKK